MTKEQGKEKEKHSKRVTIPIGEGQAKRAPDGGRLLAASITPKPRRERREEQKRRREELSTRENRVMKKPV